MNSRESGNLIDGCLWHELKALSPIDLREESGGTSIDARPESLKASFPIDLRESGNLIDFSIKHLWKARSHNMYSRGSDKLIDMRLVHSQKSVLPMYMMESSNSIVARLVHL